MYSNLVSMVVSLLKSDSISEDMRSGYADLLNRYFRNKKLIHNDEIVLIEQHIKKHGIKVENFSDSDAKGFLQKLYGNSNHTFQDNKKKRSYSEKAQQHNKPNTGNEIDELNGILSDLRNKGKKAVASRDKWKERALVAEKLLSDNSCSTNDKFKSVKKAFSKMYHPDSLKGDRFEKMIKQEIFKEFWQVIESIEKEQP